MVTHRRTEEDPERRPCGWGDADAFRGADALRIHGADYGRVLVAYRVQASQVACRAQEVVDTLSAPEQVCQSRQDTAVYLFYRIDQSRLLCAVVKRLHSEGFLITAYPC